MVRARYCAASGGGANRLKIFCRRSLHMASAETRRTGVFRGIVVRFARRRVGRTRGRPATRRGPAAPRGRAGANRNLARLACSQSSEHTGMTGRTIAHKSGSLSGAHVLLGQNHTCVARRYKRTGRQNWHVKRSVLPRTLHMTEACGVFAVQFHATVTSQRIANITSCVWHAWL